ncbi:germination protein [Paenibacillus sp. J31TS4]|nr:germination protein [Paenibacillus sp. J31TS4]
MSARQIGVIVLLYSIGTTILIIPSGLASDVKQDAWLAALAGVVLNLAFVWYYLRLSRRFGGATLIGYFRKSLGRWIGGVFALLFLLFSFLGASQVIYYIGDFSITHILPNTPMPAIHILFVSIIAMGLWLGLEPLARAAELMFPFVLLMLFLLTVALLPQVQLVNLLPVLESPPPRFVKASLTLIATATLPLAVLLMVFPVHITGDPKKGERMFLLGALIGSIVFFLISFLSITVLGARATAVYLYPSYILARMINIGDFLKRVETILALIWYITVYVKASFYFYGFVAGLTELLGLKSTRTLILPGCILLVLYSLVVYPDQAYSQLYDTTAYVPFAFFSAVVLPLFAWLVDWIREKLRRSSPPPPAPESARRSGAS